MSFKRFYVVKTDYQIYEVYCDDKDEALDMVKNKRTPLAGTPNQKGYNGMITHPPLREFNVTEELPQPKQEKES